MADKKKHIDQIINESFENDDLDFDNFAWNKVQSKLDKSTTVDKAVFSAMNPVSSQLPDGAWENMNDALDIETVWKRLEKRPKRRPFAFWWKVAGIVVLFSLIGYQFNKQHISIFTSNNSVLKNTVNKSSNHNENSSVIESKKEVEYQPTINNENTTTVNESESSKNKIVENKTPGKELEYNELKDKSNKDESTVNSIENTKNSDSIVKIEPQNITHINIDVANHNLAVNYDSLLLGKDNKKLTIGVVAEVNNTWISDVETRLGYSKNSLVYNDFSFTPYYGLFLEYKMKPKLSIVSEFFINSLMQTKNNLYQNGELTKKETELEYVKSTFLLSKNIQFNKLKERNTLQFSGGFYFSYLKRSAIKYNNVITQINSGYKLFDYGAKFGISHKIDFNRINFSYGIQTTYGLNNIFNSEGKPAYLNNTRNISYGLNIKIGYFL